MAGVYNNVNVENIKTNASNIMGGSNPPYTLSEFLEFYPQFNMQQLSADIIGMFLGISNTTVKEARWHSLWKLGMSLYTAHYLTLYLKSTTDNDSVGGVIAAGMPQGLLTSVSVGGVSKSTDYNYMAEDFKGWGDLSLTIYGQQYVSKAKMLGKGGMGVW